MTNYPEHEKMKAQKEALGTEYIGEFLEWLTENGYRIVDGHYRGSFSFEGLLAKYAEIDTAKIEAEKHAMIRAMRSEQGG